MKIIIVLIIVLTNLKIILCQHKAKSEFLITPVKVDIDSANSEITIKRIDDGEFRYYRSLSQKKESENNFELLYELGDREVDSVTILKNIEKGKVYEYEYLSETNLGYNLDFEPQFLDFSAYGNTYIASGINVDSYAKKQTVLILVDSTVYKPLKGEINQLRNDLVSEGWGVRVFQLSREDIEDKTSILFNYYKIFYEINSEIGHYINYKSLIFIGNTTKIYSGLFAPDNKSNHFGAWPADGLFGLENNKFIQEYRNGPLSEQSDWKRNHHEKGDFKYYLNSFDYNVDMMVGRIDMYNLPSFEETEVELLRRYLNKNHKYRTGQIPFRRRGLIDDELGAYNYREAPASSGWRNFNSMFSKDSISEGDYFTTLENESYMASYACGVGQPFDSIAGVGTSKDFATRQVNTIFTMLYGDYVGDWDSEDNILRAALASEPSILTAAWVGHPHWFMHHLSVGYPIGYCTRLTQNNKIYSPLRHAQDESKPEEFQDYDPYKRGVHTALLGDPTLTMYPLEEIDYAKNLTAEKLNDFTVLLSWDLPDTDSTHYYDVFRSEFEFGPFEKVNETSIADGIFSDEYHHNGDVWYMVRKKVIEQSPTATFWKLLRGKIVQTEVKTVVEGEVEGRDDYIHPNPTNGIVTISFEGELIDIEYSVYSATGTLVIQESAKTQNRELDINLSEYPAGVYMININVGEKIYTYKVVKK